MHFSDVTNTKVHPSDATNLELHFSDVTNTAVHLSDVTDIELHFSDVLNTEECRAEVTYPVLREFVLNLADDHVDLFFLLLDHSTDQSGVSGHYS